MGIFLEGEDSHGDHRLGRLVEFRFKAPPGTTSSSITTHTSSGRHNCASWASQPQKSVTLLPCPEGRTTKSTKRTCGGIGGGALNRTNRTTKRPGTWGCPLNSISAEVKNVWSYTSTPTYALIVWWLCAGRSLLSIYTWAPDDYCQNMHMHRFTLCYQWPCNAKFWYTCEWVGRGKGKAVPLQAWSGPEGSRKLRFPDFVTTAKDGGKVVSLTHRPPLPPGNAPGTHFC